MCYLLFSLMFVECCRQWPECEEVFSQNYMVRLRDVLKGPQPVGYERLTVKESVGQIFYNGTVGGHQIDPAAIPIIRRIIQNPELSRYHAVAVMTLALEGNAEDVKILARYVAETRETDGVSVRSSTYRRIFRTLACMAIRGVDGADAALRRMCDRSYWRPFADPEGDEEWTPTDGRVFEAVEALALTRCADLDRVVEDVIAKTPVARRQGMKDSVSHKELTEYVEHYDVRIYPFIPPSSRKRAVRNFNGDLENPGPIDCGD